MIHKVLAAAYKQFDKKIKKAQIEFNYWKITKVKTYI